MIALKNRFNPWGRVCLAALLLLLLLTLLSPWLAPFSFQEQDMEARLQSPSWTHWMGTDALGRDLYSRILFGARMSLAVAATTGLSALLVGTTLGLVAGFYGGWLDTLLMLIINLLLVFPSLLLAILLRMALGGGFFAILVTLTLTSWINPARLIRSQVLLLRELPFIEAAVSIGMSQARLMRVHILPHLWRPLLVALTVQIPTQILAESFLSFIGLGLQPPYSSWGTLASEGFQAMQSYPHLMIFPGLTLVGTLIALDGLGHDLQKKTASPLDQRFLA